MRAVILLIAVLLALPRPAAAAELLMFEEPGCMWCLRWHEEVGVVYRQTEEGRRAPLSRQDLHGKRPEGVAFARPVRYSPTFVLVENGVEVGRIEGYPGEDFFWGLLGRMLEALPKPGGST